jgi:hypothetical protein
LECHDLFLLENDQRRGKVRICQDSRSRQTYRENLLSMSRFQNQASRIAQHEIAPARNASDSLELHSTNARSLNPTVFRASVGSSGKRIHRKTNNHRGIARIRLAIEQVKRQDVRVVGSGNRSRKLAIQRENNVYSTRARRMRYNPINASAITSGNYNLTTSKEIRRNDTRTRTRKVKARGSQSQVKTSFRSVRRDSETTKRGSIFLIHADWRTLGDIAIGLLYPHEFEFATVAEANFRTHRGNAVVAHISVTVEERAIIDAHSSREANSF